MRNYDNSKIDVAMRRNFGGGGGRSAPPPAPKFEPPAPPPPPPPPPPAPTFMNEGAAEQNAQQGMDAYRRQGFRKSRMAGDTGGYTNPVTGASSLLG